MVSVFLRKALFCQDYARVSTHVHTLTIFLFFEVVLLHGDMDQFERNNVINAFKKKEIPIMVATDVAGMSLYEFL